MKKISYWLFTALIIGGLNQYAFAQTWTKAVSYNSTGIKEIQFVTPEIGFIETETAIVKTTDGGDVWTEITSLVIPDTVSYSALYFINQDTGYVAAKTIMYKTVDGGATWTDFEVPNPISQIAAINFLDSKNGWVLSSSTSKGMVQHTTDGGATWDTVVACNANLAGMNFYSGSSRGVAVGGGSGTMFLYYTKNGSDWVKAENPTLPAGLYTKMDIKAAFMTDSVTVQACGWGSYVGAQPSIHIKSTDGGITWVYQEQAEANHTFDNLYDIYFKDALNGIAVGGATKGSIIVRTTDGGVNWVPTSNESGPALRSIFGVGDDVVIGGETGVVLTSNDFGNSWTLKGTVPFATLNAVDAASDNVIYTGGYNALILKSSDGGKTWQNKYAKAGNVATTINGLFFLNDNLGYAAYAYGMVSKTTDGGETWTQSIHDTSAAAVAYNSIYFVDESNGYAVGKYSTKIDVIQKTTDGGQNWTKITGTTQTPLKSVSFSDVNNGIVVGDKLSSAYTTDGGATWNKSTFKNIPTDLTTANLADVAFTSGLNAVAVGYRLILRTSDGGANWDYVTDVDSALTNLVSLTFKDSSNGWALASTPLKTIGFGIYVTTDGGASWLYGKDTTDASTALTRNDISVSPSGILYAVTPETGIFALRTKPIGIDGGAYEMPNTYNLAQNYPNPFNPETNIRFTLPAQERVSLKVYDILGKEVAELVNETMNAGTHSVRFSSQSYNLASGVYFYVLRANNFTQTKKMVLLK